MTNKKTSKLPLIAFASLPLTVGLVLAQSSTSGTLAQNQTAQNQPQRVQPAQPGQRAPGSTQQNQPTGQSGTNYAGVFLQKLAAGLGITQDKLKAAAIAAGSATIDQGVKAGDFPSDLAADMKQRLQTDPFALAGGRGGRGGHDHGPRGGDFRDGGPRGMGGQVVVDAVAKALGLDAQALFQQLQGGQTISDLARAKGVSAATIRNAALSALKTQLASDVKAGRISQAQADQMYQNAQADANFGLQFGGRGMRGHQDDQNGPQGSSTDSSQTSGI